MITLKPNSLFLSVCSSVELSYTLKYFKYISMPYVVSSVEYHVILSIFAYKFESEIYCYEIVSINYINGVEQNGFNVNRLFPSDFENFISILESSF